MLAGRGLGRYQLNTLCEFNVVILRSNAMHGLPFNFVQISIVTKSLF